MVKLTKAEQARRFTELAREIEADETGATFERQFGKIVPPKRRPQKDAPKGKRKP